MRLSTEEVERENIKYINSIYEGKRKAGEIPMGCYIIPAVALLLQQGLVRTHASGFSDTPRQRQLTLLLAGGVTFGLVDHLWNGELFFTQATLVPDLALGFAITTAILAIWTIIGFSERSRQTVKEQSRQA
jgi:hypothetical protein